MIIVFNTDIIYLEYSNLQFGEYCICAVIVNSSGVDGTMSLDDNSNASIGGGTLLNMDVELFGAAR